MVLGRESILFYYQFSRFSPRSEPFYLLSLFLHRIRRVVSVKFLSDIRSERMFIKKVGFKRFDNKKGPLNFPKKEKEKNSNFAVVRSVVRD